MTEPPPLLPQQDTTVPNTDPLQVFLDSPNDVQLEHFPTYRLNLLNNKLNKQLEQILRAQFDLSIPEWRVIAILGQYGDMSVRDIASKGASDKALISRTASKLEQRQLVQRHPHPEDNRLVCLSLSETGQTLYTQVLPVAHKRQQNLLELLNKEERIALNRIIDQLLANI